VHIASQCPHQRVLTSEPLRCMDGTVAFDKLLRMEKNRASEFFYFNIISLSFVFSNYYLIIDKLSAKDLSSKLQVNCAIHYFLSVFNTLYICHKIQYDKKF